MCNRQLTYTPTPVKKITLPFKSLKLEDLVVQTFYSRFVIDSPEEMLVDLVSAAHFLHIKPMFELISLAITFYMQVCFDIMFLLLFIFYNIV